MDDFKINQWILDKLEKLDDKLDEVRLESLEMRKSFYAHEKKDEDRHRDMKIISEKIISQLDKQSESLREYNKQLEIHIEGVNTLKKGQEKMWDTVKPIIKEREETMTVKQWINKSIKNKIKIVVGIGTVAGSIATIMKFLDMF